MSTVTPPVPGLVWSSCPCCIGSGRVDHYIGDQRREGVCGYCGGQGHIFSKAPARDPVSAAIVAVVDDVMRRMTERSAS